MWNSETNHVVVTHDVIWLKLMFFEQDNTSGAIKLDADKMTDDTKEEVNLQNDEFNNNDDEEDTDQNLTPHVRFIDEILNDYTQVFAAWEGTKPDATVTLSGQISKPSERLIEVMNLLSAISNIPGTKAEICYLLWLANLEENIEQSFELGLVGASIVGTKDIEVWNIENELGLVGAGMV